MFVSGFHGTNGPLSIEDREFELSRAFVDAGVELGYSEQDLNGAESTGMYMFMSYIIINYMIIYKSTSGYMMRFII